MNCILLIHAHSIQMTMIIYRICSMSSDYIISCLHSEAHLQEIVIHASASSIHGTSADNFDSIDDSFTNDVDLVPEP